VFFGAIILQLLGKIYSPCRRAVCLIVSISTPNVSFGSLRSTVNFRPTSTGLFSFSIPPNTYTRLCLLADVCVSMRPSRALPPGTSSRSVCSPGCCSRRVEQELWMPANKPVQTAMHVRARILIPIPISDYNTID
jgi:hypothetical protein